MLHTNWNCWCYSVLEIGGIGLIVIGLALAVIPSWVFVRRTWLKNPEYFQVRSLVKRWEPLTFILNTTHGLSAIHLFVLLLILMTIKNTLLFQAFYVAAPSRQHIEFLRSIFERDDMANVWWFCYLSNFNLSFVSSQTVSDFDTGKPSVHNHRYSHVIGRGTTLICGVVWTCHLEEFVLHGPKVPCRCRLHT